MNLYKSLRRELRTPRYWFHYKQSVDLGPTIEVVNLIESMNIIKQGVSVSRFGDGEFRILTQHGEAIGFQSHDSYLSVKLEKVLNEPKNNHVVALPGPLSRSLFEMNCDARSFWIGALSDDGKLWKEAMNPDVWNNKKAVNTQVTRPYMDYFKINHFKNIAGTVFHEFKEIWKGKHVLIVEGDKTNFGDGNDLLFGAEKVSKLIVPSKNAFSKYEQILTVTKDIISNCDKKNLVVLLAIGPTATVLSYDLANRGAQILDVGHLDVEYQWYLLNAKKKIALNNKAVNEVNDINYDNITVDNQFEIVGRIE